MRLPRLTTRRLMAIVAVVGAFPAVLLPACGDGTRPSNERKVSRKWSPAEERVIGIATAHLRKLDRLPADYDVDLTRDEDRSWSVVIWRRPSTPGAYTLVLVSNTGVVLSVIPGE